MQPKNNGVTDSKLVNFSDIPGRNLSTEQFVSFRRQSVDSIIEAKKRHATENHQLYSSLKGVLSQVIPRITGDIAFFERYGISLMAISDRFLRYQEDIGPDLSEALSLNFGIDRKTQSKLHNSQINARVEGLKSVLSTLGKDITEDTKHYSRFVSVLEQITDRLNQLGEDVKSRVAADLEHLQQAARTISSGLTVLLSNKQPSAINCGHFFARVKTCIVELDLYNVIDRSIHVIRQTTSASQQDLLKELIKSVASKNVVVLTDSGAEVEPEKITITGHENALNLISECLELIDDPDVDISARLNQKIIELNAIGASDLTSALQRFEQLPTGVSPEQLKQLKSALENISVNSASVCAKITLQNTSTNLDQAPVEEPTAISISSSTMSVKAGSSPQQNSATATKVLKGAPRQKKVAVQFDRDLYQELIPFVPAKEIKKVMTSLDRARFDHVYAKLLASCGDDVKVCRSIIQANPQILLMTDTALNEYTSLLNNNLHVWLPLAHEGQSLWRAISDFSSAKLFLEGLIKVAEQEQTLQNFLHEITALGMHAQSTLVILSKGMRYKGNTFFSGRNRISQDSLFKHALQTVKHIDRAKKQYLQPTLDALISAGVIDDSRGLSINVKLNGSHVVNTLKKFAAWIMDPENSNFLMNHRYCKTPTLQEYTDELSVTKPNSAGQESLIPDINKKVSDYTSEELELLAELQREQEKLIASKTNGQDLIENSTTNIPRVLSNEELELLLQQIADITKELQFGNEPSALEEQLHALRSGSIHVADHDAEKLVTTLLSTFNSAQTMQQEAAANLLASTLRELAVHNSNILVKIANRLNSANFTDRLITQYVLWDALPDISRAPSTSSADVCLAVATQISKYMSNPMLGEQLKYEEFQDSKNWEEIYHDLVKQIGVTAVNLWEAFVHLADNGDDFAIGVAELITLPDIKV